MVTLMEDAGDSPATIEAAIQTLLDELDSDLSKLAANLGMDIDTLAGLFGLSTAALAAALTLTEAQVTAALGGLSTIHQAVIRPGNPHLHAGVIIYETVGFGFDALPAAERSVIVPIRYADIDWVGVLEEDDTITISNAEDAANNRSEPVLYGPYGHSEDYVSNGDFATGDGGAPEGADDWTMGVGGAWSTNWTWAAGSVTHVTGTHPIYQDPSDMAIAPSGTDSDKFLVVVTVSGITAGSLDVMWGTARYGNIAADGTHYFYVAEDGVTGLILTPTTNFDGVVSSVKMHKFPGVVVTGSLTENANDTRAIITLSER